MFDALLDRFRTWNRRRIARLRRQKPATETVFGFRMNAIREMQTGRFEPVETALIRTLLSKSDRFLNVGANMGYYCCFSQLAGVPTVAFEPVASNVQFIIQNMKANGWGDNITVLPVAAGESPGFAEIYGIGTGASLLDGWGRNPSSLSDVVPVVRIDDCVRPPSDGERLLVLMDVEGYEHFALRGAEALIGADPKPVWVIEVISGETGSEQESRAKATFDLLFSAGYKALSFTDALDVVEGPLDGNRNYLFVDRSLDIADILGDRDTWFSPVEPSDAPLR